MARLALLLLLVSACSFERFAASLEEVATRRSGSDVPQARWDAESVLAECQYEATRQRFRRVHTMNAKWEQEYLNACFREITIMRAHGRR